jgi:hypothetical protein
VIRTLDVEAEAAAGLSAAADGVVAGRPKKHGKARTTDREK